MLICNCLDLSNNKTSAIMITDMDDEYVTLSIKDDTMKSLDKKTFEVVQTSVVNILDKDKKPEFKNIVGMGLYVEHDKKRAKLVPKEDVKAYKEL